MRCPTPQCPPSLLVRHSLLRAGDDAQPADSSLCVIYNYRKDAGNTQYKAKNFAGAIDLYGKAIALAAAQGSPNPTFFLNRASVRLRRHSE